MVEVLPQITEYGGNSDNVIHSDKYKVKCDKIFFSFKRARDHERTKECCNK